MTSPKFVEYYVYRRNFFSIEACLPISPKEIEFLRNRTKIFRRSRSTIAENPRFFIFVSGQLQDSRGRKCYLFLHLMQMVWSYGS